MRCDKLAKRSPRLREARSMGTQGKPETPAQPEPPDAGTTPAEPETTAAAEENPPEPEKSAEDNKKREERDKPAEPEQKRAGPEGSTALEQKPAEPEKSTLDRLIRWLAQRPALGSFAQLGSFFVAVGACILSGFALKVGCANEANSKLSASTNRARDEREVVRDALAALRSSDSALWPWQPVRQWASRESARLAALSAKGPVVGDGTLSGNYFVEAQRLGESWARDLGEPTPAAFDYCMNVQRQIKALETALDEGRLSAKALDEQLGSELRRFAADLAPRCALTFALSAGDRAVFVAGFFFPSKGRQFSDDPFSAVGQWQSSRLLEKFELRKHPAQRPALAALNIPRAAFSGCNGLLNTLEAAASPRLEAGQVAFHFQALWSDKPGARMPCLLLGATEVALVDTGTGLREQLVPPREGDWLLLEFSADGDAEATFYAAAHGLPVRARVDHQKIDWRVGHTFRLSWDATKLNADQALVLTVDDAAEGGQVEASPRFAVTDPRAPLFAGPVTAEPVSLQCEARFVAKNASDPVPQCFRRSDGGTRRYAYCRMPARREFRFGESWIFIESRPPGLDLLVGGWPGCEVVERQNAAWTALPPRCRARPVGGTDCNRRMADGRVVDFGDENRMHEEEAVGSGCEAVMCTVFAGDTPESGQ